MSEQSSGFEGTQPVRVGVDLDKYIDQRIEAGFRARENVLWRVLWKWLLVSIGGGGVGGLLTLLFS